MHFVAPGRLPDSRPLDLEVVFATGRSDLIAIAKSILMSAEIRFFARGEDVQDLFGYGRFPAGYNVFMGPMQILVSSADAHDARALLADLSSEPFSQSPAPDVSGDEDGADRAGLLWRSAKLGAKVAAAVMLAGAALEVLIGLLQR